MKAKRWSNRILAVSLVTSVLFTGNALISRGEASQPEETLAVVQPPETTAATAPPTTVPTETEPVQNAACVVAAEGADGRHIFAYDVKNEKMVYSNTPGTDKLYPASITKLYSAMVALMYLDPEDVITAGEELRLVQSDSSRAYVGKGCRLTVEMLIEAMLVASGSDASYVVAAAAGRAIADDETMGATQAVEVFIAELNREAFRLGLQNSHFMNPDGYHDDEHYSCPDDVALMASLALKDPVIAKYIAVQQDSVVFESGETIAWYNANHLINPESPYYAASAVGMKTGYTDAAGHCLLGAFRDGQKEVIVGIFGSQERYPRYETAAELFKACG